MGRLDEIDLTVKLSRQDGARRLAAAQQRLTALALQAGGQLGERPSEGASGSGGESGSSGALGPAVAVAFEGWDASGKGGAIRRLTERLDPRHVTVTSSPAPTELEQRHHFLWRFHDGIPARGAIGVFDRTWYGRVLVERVEGFASEEKWTRAYDEIVQFERSLVAEGTVLVKFWLHISPEEQLRRFQSREKDPLKAWKLTDDDWRNRDKRPAYEQAVEEMLRRTDTKHAPWHVISAESKPLARVAVVEAVVEALEDGLRAAGITPTELGR
jgi:AMP-polyphosphate phosphotransferase